MKRVFSVAVAATVAISLSGCAHVPKFLSWLRPHPRYAQIKPIPLDLPTSDPMAAEDRLYARAVSAIEERDYGTALDVLQLAKDAKPDDPRVLTAMGVVYDKLGRFDLSSRYYDLAEKADPGSKVVAINRRYSQFLQQHQNMNEGDGAVMLAANAGLAPTPTSAPTAAKASAASPATATEVRADASAIPSQQPLGKTESANLVATADFSVRPGFASAMVLRGD